MMRCITVDCRVGGLENRIGQDKKVTYDLKASPSDLTAVKCSEMTEAIIEKIKAGQSKNGK